MTFSKTSVCFHHTFFLCILILSFLFQACDITGVIPGKQDTPDNLDVEVWVIGSNGIAVGDNEPTRIPEWLGNFASLTFPGRSSRKIEIVYNTAYWGPNLGGTFEEGLINVSSEMFHALSLDKSNAALANKAMEHKTLNLLSGTGVISSDKYGNINSYKLVNTSILPLLAEDIQTSTKKRIDRWDVVILAGYSGGGQISLNAAHYLNTKYSDRSLVDGVILLASPVHYKYSTGGDVRAWDVLPAISDALYKKADSVFDAIRAPAGHSEFAAVKEAADALKAKKNTLLTFPLTLAKDGNLIKVSSYLPLNIALEVRRKLLPDAQPNLHQVAYNIGHILGFMGSDDTLTGSVGMLLYNKPLGYYDKGTATGGSYVDLLKANNMEIHWASGKGHYHIFNNDENGKKQQSQAVNFIDTLLQDHVKAFPGSH
ncbi:hypothetical protein P0082_05545 [Candidatus Haliotispira prima]|uniref:Uncharacterized protein n=1 Tax=Candidatus Haliotispira prima TaxID=3034016 RepID=A0ABY8MJW8_9SPIO|nr:hypothetical protein P0082_05545 [Candidatus Haliotispira prima]